MRSEALQTIHELERWGHEHRWSGSDQYDALNGTRIPGFVRDRVLGRQLVIQAVKRSAVDLRPLLGIQPGRNAVSVAWAASAYAINGFLPEAEADDRLVAAVAMLEQLRCPTYAEPCWGYHFDFQSRVFFYPKSAPNVIATVYAGMALCDAYDRLRDPRLLERAHEVARFLKTHVPQTHDPPGAFFGYLVGDRSPIHNSNMHVCALLSRVSALTGDQGLADAARLGAEWTTARQRADGSWPYGERSNLSWVDGFHTGYVLDALDTCIGSGTSADDGVLQRGLEFYRREMVLGDGTPKYFHHDTYPIDMWSVAQAIQTLANAARRRNDAELRDQAWTVFRFASQRMRRRDGMFFFQRRRLWSNRRCHVRGVVAPTFLALAHLLRLESARTPRETELSLARSQ